MVNVGNGYGKMPTGIGGISGGMKVDGDAEDMPAMRRGGKVNEEGARHERGESKAKERSEKT